METSRAVTALRAGEAEAPPKASQLRYKGLSCT
jgi:hypothetical protein